MGITTERDASIILRTNCYSCLFSLCRGFLIESTDKKRNSQKQKFFANIRHCFIQLFIFKVPCTCISRLLESCEYNILAFKKRCTRKAKITKELENFVKDFGFCRQFILTSNTFTCFLLFFFSLFFFFFLFHIVCREKLKHIIYTNIMLYIQISTHLQLTKNQFLMI